MAFAEEPPATSDAILDVNVRAVVTLTRALLPGMLARRSGTVLNVVSMSAFQPVPFLASYAASKAFLLSFSESLAEELRGSGVRVVTLLPGYVDTPLTRENRYAMPFLLSPEVFADRAFAAIEAGSSYRVIPWQMGVVAKLLRLLPNAWFDRLLAGRGRKHRQGQGRPAS